MKNGNYTLNTSIQKKKLMQKLRFVFGYVKLNSEKITLVFKFISLGNS